MEQNYNNLKLCGFAHLGIDFKNSLDMIPNQQGWKANFQLYGHIYTLADTKSK